MIKGTLLYNAEKNTYSNSEYVMYKNYSSGMWVLKKTNNEIIDSDQLRDTLASKNNLDLIHSKGTEIMSVSDVRTLAKEKAQALLSAGSVAELHEVIRQIRGNPIDSENMIQDHIQKVIDGTVNSVTAMHGMPEQTVLIVRECIRSEALEIIRNKILKEETSLIREGNLLRNVVGLQLSTMYQSEIDLAYKLAEQMVNEGGVGALTPPIVKAASYFDMVHDKIKEPFKTYSFTEDDIVLLMIARAFYDVIKTLKQYENFTGQINAGQGAFYGGTYSPQKALDQMYPMNGHYEEPEKMRPITAAQTVSDMIPTFTPVQRFQLFKFVSEAVKLKAQDFEALYTIDASVSEVLFKGQDVAMMKSVMKHISDKWYEVLGKTTFDPQTSVDLIAVLHSLLPQYYPTGIALEEPEELHELRQELAANAMDLSMVEVSDPEVNSEVKAFTETMIATAPADTGLSVRRGQLPLVTSTDGVSVPAQGFISKSRQSVYGPEMFLERFKTIEADLIQREVDAINTALHDAFANNKCVYDTVAGTVTVKVTPLNLNNLIISKVEVLLQQAGWTVGPLTGNQLTISAKLK